MKSNVKKRIMRDDKMKKENSLSKPEMEIAFYSKMIFLIYNLYKCLHIYYHKGK